MTRGPLSATHLTDRTPEEIRRLAGARGYEPHGLPDAKDNPIRDPATGDKHFPFR
jgi:hypothetical protein